SSVLRNALDSVRHIDDEGFRGAALAALIGDVPSDALAACLDIALKIADAHTRAHVLLALVRRTYAGGDESIRRSVLHAAFRIRESSLRESILAALAPHLSDKLQKKALPPPCRRSNAYRSP